MTSHASLNEPIPQRILGYKGPESMQLDSEGDPVPGTEDFPVEPTAEFGSNLVSSLCYDGKHRPALDVDVPVRLIPSSSPDHWHLYFPTIALDRDEYFALLDALARAGIVGHRYVRHSKRRGATWLRLPGVLKGEAS